MKYQIGKKKGQLLSDGQGKGAITLRQVRKRGYNCQTCKEKGQLLSDRQGKETITVKTGKGKGELLCVIGSSYNE